MKSALLYYSLKGNTVGILSDLRETEFDYIVDLTEGRPSEYAVQDIIDDCSIILLGIPSYYPTYQLKPDYPKFLKKYKRNLLTLEGKRVIIFGSGRSEYTHYCGAQDYFYRQLRAKNIVTTFKFEGYPRQSEIDRFTNMVRDELEKGEKIWQRYTKS